MRKVISLNKDWFFIQNVTDIREIDPSRMSAVDLPHTWNGKDGQDGDGLYFRGTCAYRKSIAPLFLDAEEAYLEFDGVAMSATVFVNGTKLLSHRGGYSRFRVRITEALRNDADNELVVLADNGENAEVYPQRADFTFYGGIYRDVRLLIVPHVHFDLDYFGGEGLKVTPREDGRVAVECFFNDPIHDFLRVDILDEGKIVARTEVPVNGRKASTTLRVENVHLWNGTQDPHLYTIHARIRDDELQTRFGFRTFRVDPSRGFLLNGKEYPLIGVSRHQDRKDVGNALTPGMHEEDFRLMREMGASTIRLAHYQHDPLAYRLADEMGFVLWTEIPYISEDLKDGRANAVSQMKELIVQNYHHPSVFFYGLSNEITVAGGVTPRILRTHRILQRLCRRMDSSRLTTMANLFLLEPDSKLLRIPDVRSYNLYYGWYVGEMGETDQWLDDFHTKHPDMAIGLSEYGADANPAYQSPHPVKGDYSESYQALYHEHMLRMRQERPYLWAMHAWNMFDFAADARNEGGGNGINQKGLVTFDRKIKKDAFFIYKAYLSKEPFVHLTGRRYRERTESPTQIKVYSNQERVSLFVDGVFFQEKTGEKVFVFTVEITGCHRIRAVSGTCSDEIEIERTERENPGYACAERMETVNWFDAGTIVVKEGFFSVRDRVADIKKHPEAGKVYAGLMEQAMARLGDVAKKVKIPKFLEKRMDQMTLEATLKMAGHLVKPEMVKQINDALSEIKK